MKKLYVIGSPIDHSLSPVIHNAGLHELGLEKEYSYDRLDIGSRGLENFIASIRNQEIHGASVTMPNKMAIIPFLDELSTDASILKAVNTIYCENGIVKGHNTDGPGFIRALSDEKIDLKGKSVIMMGAGGSARSISLSLARAGIFKLTIVNRTLNRGKELADIVSPLIDENIEVFEPDRLTNILGGGDLLVNTVPLELAGYECYPKILAHHIHSNLIVNDIVYKPLKTRLLAEAEKAGARAINGTGMLIHQATEQFRIFTGQPAPVQIMKNALMEVLNESDS